MLAAGHMMAALPTRPHGVMRRDFFSFIAGGIPI
jgi:hypothetical protein